jgi:hypothetical protein
LAKSARVLKVVFHFQLAATRIAGAAQATALGTLVFMLKAGQESNTQPLYFIPQGLKAGCSQARRGLAFI